jgi:hypothetical protein
MVVGATTALLTVRAGTAFTQVNGDPNSGALTVTGGVDVLPGRPYIFRGFVQEADPKITLWPYVDLGFALASGDGALESIGVNVGVWSSVQTGSSGSGGPTGGAHYEQDFYVTLNLGLGGGVAVGTTYMALTSPNGLFDTTKELQFKFTKAHGINPYGFLAIELNAPFLTADGGNNKGTYLELGVSPAVPLGTKRVTLNIPAKVGLSVKDYYELDGKDRRFGFFDVGALVAFPLSSLPSRIGSVSIRGGFDLVVMGERTKRANDDQSTKVVGLIGVGFSY